MKRLPALMRAGKEMQEDEAAKTLLGAQKKKTRREEQIDRKIERLLETYKRQDEELVRKARERERTKDLGKKLLRDKFGFSDDEEDEDEEVRPLLGGKKPALSAQVS